MSERSQKKLLAENLSSLIPAFHQKFVQQMNFPVPPNHFHTLIRLHHDGALTLTELSARLQISKQQMSPIIEKLLLSGYIVRHQNPADRRSTKISITPKGYALLEEHHEDLKKIFIEKVNHLSASQVNALNKQFTAFMELFSKLP